MYKRLSNILIKLLPFKIIEYYYLKCGKKFADLHVLRRFSLTKKDEYKRAFADWTFWKYEYARRGYRTLSIEDFIEMGGLSGHIHEEDVRVKREKDEEPSLHQDIFH